MEKKAKVPKLRFPGFTEDWEQRKFGEIVATRRGLTYSPSDICENGVRVLRSSNINGDTFQVSPDDVFVNREAVNIEYASENDILITSANGSSRLVGKHALMLNISDKSTVHGGFMLLATAKEPNFINASMSSDWYKKFIDMYVSGGNGAIGNLSKLDLDSQIIYVPSQLEQKQVGAFFKKLDNLITLHQRKLTHLQAKKKSLLQKMFPKKGERFPEIRFPGFTDAWEQRYLGEITDSYSGGTPSVGVKEYYGGDIPFIRSAEINSNKTELSITPKGLKNSSARMVNIGDILYALYGATSGEVGLASLKGAVNQAVLVIQPHDEYCPEFLMQWLRKSKQNIIDTYLQGGQGNLSGTIVKSLVIDCPSQEEQKQIGAYFKSFDTLITLHQRKLAHLQTQKKALLQQMFV